ncbi:uncharacterized protein C2845_PM07G12530 [Panicum miliaceum]|uniref:RWP-RK domain-containing protein n=1 Tax=Panicum miliaceum TaxID=4540 RepID=A0A3L6SLA0_PANMI|nr:uncharacterized protein C2845_PM07G12530 [Panicum miliaceum]
MAQCCDGRDDDWYQYGLNDFPPLCSAPPPLALLSAEDYRLPIAVAPPPGHVMSRSDGGGLIVGSCHGALEAAAADCPSSALMNLRGDESYYDLTLFSAPPPAGEPYFFDQLPPVPADGATVGLDDALLRPLGDIDLEAFDNADEHKMIVPAGQHTVGQDYAAGVDVVHADQKPLAIADSFRPRANAFEITMSRHEEHQKSSSVAALMPSPPPPLPRPRGRRSVDHRSAPVHGKTRLDHIDFDELRKYFYMHITRAAQELNVGLTVLKKRCSELGIARWPHRKMKSLKSLILNVQEMGTGMNPAAVQQELAALETYCALMEENPAIELSERTKKLRQACFKESYKRRRAAAVNVMDHIFSFDDHKYRHQLPPPSSAERHGHGSSFFGY